MAFHISNLGSFGGSINTDIDGYVPEASDGPWDLNVGHGESTHGPDGELTEYGQWWERDGFPAWRNAAIRDTRRAMRQLRLWQEQNA